MAELPPSGSIAADTALISRFCSGARRKARAGDRKDGHLTFQGKERARFFGVCLLPPAAFLRAEAAEQLADRLSRSGINLVRLGDLDTALGPTVA